MRLRGLQVQMRFGSVLLRVDARLQSATHDEPIGRAAGILTASSAQELLGDPS